MNCLNLRHKLYYVCLLFYIIHGSVGLDNVEICEEHVYSVFHGHYYPNSNFVDAFTEYTWASLGHPAKNYNARGYFEKLIDTVEDIDVSIMKSPNEFCKQFKKAEDESHPGGTSCEAPPGGTSYEAPPGEDLLCSEAMYILLGNRELDHDQEVIRILDNMSNFAVFKHVYMNESKSSLAFENAFPQQEKPPTLEDGSDEIAKEAYIQAYNEWVFDYQVKLRTLDIAGQYFHHLTNTAVNIANITEFITVEQYCAQFALNYVDEDEGQNEGENEDDDEE